MNRKRRKLRKGRVFLLILLLLVVALAVVAWQFFGPERWYTAEELGIATVQSEKDFDGDGLDDLTDILLGARAYIETEPVYKSVYYEGGYPTDEYGVCTDVIWQAFKAAGYDLKALVDADVAAEPAVYGIEAPDPNIDFRRVVNLKVFFDRYAQSLSTTLDDVAEWQAGDIVVFPGHIGICSDKRNEDGIPFLIHHGNPIMGAVERNHLVRYDEIIGHYRWIPR